jgi:tartrate-resistant acid phosphatase type 5
MMRTLLSLPLIVALVAGVGWLWQRADVFVVEEPITASPGDCPGDVQFAVIGDYGVNKQPAAHVAALVHGWNPDFIVTVGDNNYPAGAADTIDANVGQYYSDYIYPYAGEYGPGAEENRFFPVLGNHDLNTDLGQAYFDYFELPGNERYYDIRQGPVHLFFLNSDPREPDGHTAASVQAMWLKEQLAASDAPWKLVIMHHTPYTSYLLRAADRDLRWPFHAWGADAVLSGHDHFYERLLVNGIPYFINGAGGGDLYRIGMGAQGSVVRYNQEHGAMQVQAEDMCINFSFYNRTGEFIDSYTLRP